MFLKSLLIAVLSFGLTSCCSDGDKVPSDAVKITGPSKYSIEDCQAPPEPVMCCQAMTPACIECQEKARLSVEKWEIDCRGNTFLQQNP